MARNVFILGAGASVASGAPLMKDFVDVIEDLYLSEITCIDRVSFKRVLDLYRELQSVYAKSYLSLDNIEHLFGAIELARIIKRLSDHTYDEILQAREDLVTVITQTIENSTKFPFRILEGTRPQMHEIVPTGSYQAFVELMKPFENSCVITFNYDMALDLALNRNNLRIDYGLFQQESSDNVVKLLKLHGSLNWGTCLKCKGIVSYNLEDFFANHSGKYLKAVSGPVEVSGTPLEMLNCFQEVRCNKCSLELTRLGLIVPPTWSKFEYQESISEVWNTAAKELAEAVNIFVIGYSLPESDSFFRYLYALGTLGNARIRRFWTFDPDPSVHRRFEELIGRSIKDRFKSFELKFLEPGEPDFYQTLRTEIHVNKVL